LVVIAGFGGLVEEREGELGGVESEGGALVALEDAGEVAGDGDGADAVAEGGDEEVGEERFGE
jgi:hypothetical protein